jgi:hypothetical protein
MRKNQPTKFLATAGHGGARPQLFLSAVIALAWLSTAAPSLAQTLSGLRTPSGPVAPGTDTEIIVELTDALRNAACGISVRFGDGNTRDFRIGDQTGPAIAFRIPYRYASAGNYIVEISGKSLFSGIIPIWACQGPEVSGVISVGTQAVEGNPQPSREPPRPSASSLKEREEALQRRARELEAQTRRIELAERLRQLEEREQALRQRESMPAVTTTASAAPPITTTSAPTSAASRVDLVVNAPDLGALLSQTVGLTSVQLRERSEKLRGEQYSGKGKLQNLVDDQECESGSVYPRCGQLLVSIDVFTRVLIQVPSPVSGVIARLSVGDEFSFANCRLISIAVRRATCDLLR